MKNSDVTSAQRAEILKVLYEDRGELNEEYWALRGAFDWGHDGPFDWTRLLRLLEAEKRKHVSG